jgi:hypothetical protein
MPDWMMAVFSIVNCCVYGVKISGTITSAMVVEILVIGVLFRVRLSYVSPRTATGRPGG